MGTSTAQARDNYDNKEMNDNNIMAYLRYKQHASSDDATQDAPAVCEALTLVCDPSPGQPLPARGQ